MNGRVGKMTGLTVMMFIALFYSCGANSGKEYPSDRPVSEQMVNTDKNSLTNDQVDAKTSWKVSKINGMPASAIFDVTPTISFDPAASRVYGTTGCNRYSGMYVLNKGSFKISGVAATRMACMGKNDEAGFISALEGTTSAKIEGNSLLFLKGNDIILEFLK